MKCLNFTSCSLKQGCTNFLQRADFTQTDETVGQLHSVLIAFVSEINGKGCIFQIEVCFDDGHFYMYDHRTKTCWLFFTRLYNDSTI